jgi:hypothetical protein
MPTLNYAMIEMLSRLEKYSIFIRPYPFDSTGFKPIK